MRTNEAFRGRKDFGIGFRDTQLTTDGSFLDCVDSLLTSLYDLARAWGDGSAEA